MTEEPETAASMTTVQVQQLLGEIAAKDAIARNTAAPRWAHGRVEADVARRH